VCATKEDTFTSLQEILVIVKTVLDEDSTETKAAADFGEVMEATAER
jgi:hypothetical protein